MSTDVLPNGRDLGGHRTSGGPVVATGHIFRSAAPGDDDSRAALAALGITTVVDLRTQPERDQRPDLLPASTRHVIADILADAPSSGAASMGSMATAVLGGETDVAAVEVRAVMIDSYRTFVTLPSARRATADVLSLLVSQDAGPVLLHCTAGKDRTGWLVALLLTILDVPAEDVLADYLASGPAVSKLLAPYLAAASDAGHDIAAFAPALTVDEAYLDAAWEAMSEAYGSLTNYLAGGLGLAPDFRDRLGARLLRG